MLDEQEQAQATAVTAETETVRQTTEKYLFRPNAEGAVTAEERERGLADMRDSFTKLQQHALKIGDADGDGKLSDAEQQALSERIHQQQEKRISNYVKKYDADSDGKLSDVERQQMNDGVRQEIAARFAGFDTNGDGYLDPDERARFFDDMGKELFGE